MERTANSLTQQMAGAAARRAPMPGRGVGNVPHAPGMISGSFGPRGGPMGQPPTGPGPRPEGPAPGAPPAPAPGPQAGPSPMGAAVGGGLPPYLDPSYLMAIYAALMDAYVKVAQSPRLPWGYS